MAEKKDKADKPKKPILPSNPDRPTDFKIVYFKYVGDSIKYGKATLTSYVSPEIAAIYEKKMAKYKAAGKECNILKVE